MRRFARRRHQLQLLVVTAVAAERDAILRGLGLPVVEEPMAALAQGDPIVVSVAGVGPAAAAADAAWLLGAASSVRPFDAVLCAGVAGGFAGHAPVGATVLAARSIAADLGAETPDGFVPLADLGYGSSTVEAEAGLLAQLRAALPAAVVGDLLTVQTVTGSQAGADMLLARWPGAVAEAMEGFGVASAAQRAGVAFAELRTIANPVGPRDRAAWRLTEALAALAEAAPALATLYR